MNPQRITPQVAADDFNHAIAVGDWIRYREIKGEGEGTLYRTKTKAQVLGGHSAVVWLEGKSGCVCCDHCEKATPEDIQTIEDTMNAGAFVKTEPEKPSIAADVMLLAADLEEAAAEWRIVAGYTGTQVHRPCYWITLADRVTRKQQMREPAKPPAVYLLASVKHSYTGDPLVAWWRPDGRGYTISIAEAGTFTKTEALAHEYASNATVAIPLSDLGHRLMADDTGDRYPFTDGNKALLELLLATSCNRRFTRPDR